MMKRALLMITNHKALFDLIIPAGISLMAVRGFFASKLLSNQRLKAIAAERANTIHKITKMKIQVLPMKNIFVF